MIQSYVVTVPGSEIDEDTREVFESCLGENYNEVTHRIVDESIERLRSNGTVTLDVNYMNDKAINDVDKVDISILSEEIRSMIIDELKDMRLSGDFPGMDKVYFLEDAGSSIVFALDKGTLVTAVRLRIDKVLRTDIPEDELTAAAELYDILCFEKDLRRSDKRILPVDEYDERMFMAYGVAKGYADSDDEDVLREASRIKVYLNNGGYERYKAAFDYLNGVSTHSDYCVCDIEQNGLSMKDLIENARMNMINEDLKFIRCIEF